MSELKDEIPLVLNIGVAGHRPDGLQYAKPDVLSAQITETLKLIAEEVELRFLQPNIWYTDMLG